MLEDNRYLTECVTHESDIWYSAADYTTALYTLWFILVWLRDSGYSL